MTPLQSAVEAEILARKGRRRGSEMYFLAPCHDEQRPSARWNPDKLTWFCDPCDCGGGIKDLAERLGIAEPARQERQEFAAEYDYRDEAGKLLFQVVRRMGVPKADAFRQRRPDGPGGWVWKLGDTRRVLYRLPELLAADPARCVLIPEGEKDVDRLRALGIVATCNPHGAGKWQPQYAEPLRGRNVAILPDHDEPGRKHAEAVARSLEGLASSVRIVALRGLPEKGDVSDWLDAGGTPDALRELVKAAPLWAREFDSAEPPVVAAESKLRFHTARQIGQETPAEVPWRAEPWIADGAITEVDGKVKAAGKSTWLLALCRAVLDGEPFMGKPTAKSPVVYLTEQGARSFREALRRADLLDRDDFHVLHWHDTIGVDWPAVVAAGIEQAARCGARLLVVDTLAQFAGLKGDAENNSGDALKAMQPLQSAAASHGLAVAFARHDRKSGGDVGDSGRGSSAYAGAVDVVLSIRRPEGNSRPSMRVIHALSRFDETPATLTVELTDAGYVALGSEAVVLIEAAKRTILDAAPATEDGALQLDDLLALVASEVKRTTGQAAVEALLAVDALDRCGQGKRGDPFRYWRTDPLRRDDSPEMVSAAPMEVVAAERNGWPGVSPEPPPPILEMLSARTPHIEAAERNGHAPAILEAAPLGACKDCHTPVGNRQRQCADCMDRERRAEAGAA